jgi:hypothetical protein
MMFGVAGGVATASDLVKTPIPGKGKAVGAGAGVGIAVRRRGMFAKTSGVALSSDTRVVDWGVGSSESVPRGGF